MAFGLRPVNVYVKKNIKWADPIDLAQQVFAYKPEEYKRAADAQNSFLQSIADTENLRRGIDTANQQYFKPVTSTMKDSSSNMMNILLDIKSTSISDILGDKDKANFF